VRWIPDRYRDLRSSMSREDLDGDIEDEFRLHLELLTEENIARGMAPDLALHEAEGRMGDMDRWKAEMRRAEMRIQRGSFAVNEWGSFFARPDRPHEVSCGGRGSRASCF
jgi:hypothetical protein